MRTSDAQTYLGDHVFLIVCEYLGEVFLIHPLQFTPSSPQHTQFKDCDAAWFFSNASAKSSDLKNSKYSTDGEKVWC